jgi:hypothetical protein
MDQELFSIGNGGRYLYLKEYDPDTLEWIHNGGRATKMGLGTAVLWLRILKRDYKISAYITSAQEDDSD